MPDRRPDRRHAVLGPLALFAAYALVREARAFAPTDRRLSATRWIARQDEMARALARGEMTPLAWGSEVRRLAHDLDVAQLRAEIGRGRQTPAGAPFMRDPVKRNIRFVDEQGEPRRVAYGAATFSFTPANVITPHAHRHMASAHMVIEGRVRIRTFDRVRDEADALVIRPSGDRVAGVGEAAAMTSAKDNIHWFAPGSERAETFDVIVSDLDPGQPSYLIQPVDPLGGKRLEDGTIRARLLSFEESMRRYSPTV
jgi:hypothetical protein